MFNLAFINKTNKKKGIFYPFPKSYSHWWETTPLKVWIYWNELRAAAPSYPVIWQKSNGSTHKVFSMKVKVSKTSLIKWFNLTRTKVP